MKPSTLLAGAAALVGAMAFAPLEASADRDLSGRWVMVQLATTVAEVPVVGEIHATSRLVALHDLTHSGDKLEGPGRLCSLELDSGSRFVETKLSKAFKRALPRPVIDGRIGKNSDGKVTFTQTKRTVVVGAKLPNPLRDPLPKGPKDKTVLDQDKDGKPGVTISIDGIVTGDIHVAQRSWTRLAGTAVGREGFSGRLSFGNEQSILSTTSSMLDDPPKARPVPKLSWFKMTRLPDDASCKSARSVAKRWLQ